jgi:RNA polymerase sigma-70 factor (ECF subfamily)
LSRPKTKADAFLELLLPLQKPLEVYCRRLLRNPSLVEDVLQTAVASAFAKFQEQAPIDNFKAWIFRFVTLESFNSNRKHEPVSFGDVPVDLAAEESWDLVTREDTFSAMLEDPDVLLEHFDDVVIAALERLPAVERAVLLLRAIGEFNYREIQELLSIPLGSVIGYLARARKRLRLSLADYAAERGLYPRGPVSGGPHP